MENIKLSLNGYRLDGEFKNIPLAFVNALRRILTSEVPTVVVSNVQILDNTTTLTHEMLRHRVEQLPVNVLPDETAVIRDTKLEMRFLSSPDGREITSDDFVVTGPRKNVLLPDRDLDEPIFFMNLGENQSLHITANLSIETKGVSQVCPATFKNHIDPERARLDKDSYILTGGDPKVFDNFYIQRSFSVDENGRPNWFDFTVESMGTTKAKDLVKSAVQVLQTKITEFVKLPILREEANMYRMEIEGETYTLGELAQKIIYDGALTDWVSYDIGHPLKPILTLRFTTKTPAEKVIERFKEESLALCERVLKSV
jgi:DNA-directed RNA polymerase alpha subunit